MILFTDSVSYCDAPGFGSKYTLSGSLQYAILAGRYGGYSLFAFNTGFGTWTATKVLGSRQLWRVHQSFRAHTSGGGAPPNSIFGRLESPSNHLLHWKIAPTGKITFYTGGLGTNASPGSVIMTSNTSFPFDAWHTIEIEAKFGSPGYLRLYVDDSLDVEINPLTWVNPTYPDRFSHYWSSLGLQGVQWCDLVISDDQGTRNTARLGPCNTVCGFPVADALSQWFRNLEASDAAAVNEQNGALHGAPNFNYNYIDGGAGLVDLFTFAKPRCFGLNLAVAANACAVNGTLELVVRPRPSSLAINTIGSSMSPGASYATLQAISEASPVSGTNWTDSDIGAAWWGVRGVSATPRVTQHFLEKVTSLRPVPFTCGGGDYVV